MDQINEKRKELALTLAKMRVGREPNLKKAKNLRIEIARLLGQKKESK